MFEVQRGNGGWRHALEGPAEGPPTGPPRLGWGQAHESDSEPLLFSGGSGWPHAAPGPAVPSASAWAYSAAEVLLVLVCEVAQG